MNYAWVAWVAQSVRHLTLDLNSGLNLRVMNSSPVLGSMLSMESTLRKIKKEFMNYGGLSPNYLFLESH